MELKTTEEFVREAHGAACSTWKQRIEKEFPELFKTELEVGKWYKLKYGEIEWLMNYQGRGFVSYGFNPTKEYINGYVIHNHDNLQPVTTEEVESALIAEAKKRGYKAGNFKCFFGQENQFNENTHNWFFCKIEKSLFTAPNGRGGACLFHDGKWAEILHEEKTTISKEKALKILAKKLKVSPESIEIQ